jgi:thymidylate synthase
MMNNLDRQYTDLLQDILDNGVRKEDRTGTGTISVFGRQIRHKMSEGFPVLTTKKMAWKTMVTELIWFLRGDTNIKFLVDNGCHIWDGDVYKNYLNVVTFEKPDYFHEKHGHLKMSVKKEGDNYLPLTQEEFINRIKTDYKFTHWGELGPVYGKQWRKWRGQDGMIGEKDENGTRIITWNQIDQITNLINDLKTNPDSRRLMVNAWNVGEIDQMVLPPCHYGFQVYTRELSLEERRKLANHDSQFISPITVESWDRANIPTRAISLMWNQRSVDTFLGLPFNIASYGLLLEIIAKEVNMVPDELIGNLGDVHLYSNHIEQTKEQIGRELTFQERIELVKGHKEIYGAMSPFSSNDGIMRICDEHSIAKRTREPFPLPKLLCLDEYHYLMDKELVGDIPFTEKIEKFRPDFFTLENYQSHPTIKAPLSN